MRAAVFQEAHRPLEIMEVPTPQISENDLLIRVEACGLCHTDLHYIDHGTPTFKKPPLILGHEASGTVAEIGKNVRNFKKGDPALIPAVLSCRSCPLCLSGRSNICQNMNMLGNHIDGAFAEYIKVPAIEVLKLPPEIPLQEASVVADAVSTAYHAAAVRGKVQPDQWVVVMGCGGVGINVVQVTHHLGASVIAVDLDPGKLELAKLLGADHVFQPSAEKEWLKKVRSITGGGAHVAFECIGRPETQARAHDTVRRGGRLCIVGYSEQPATIALSKVMFYEQELVGSLGCRFSDYPAVIDLIAEGKIKIEPLVSERFPLSRINEALDRLRKGLGMRNLILPWADRT